MTPNFLKPLRVPSRYHPNRANLAIVHGWLRHTERFEFPQQNPLPKAQLWFGNDHRQPVLRIIFKNTNRLLRLSIDMFEQACSNTICLSKVDTVGMVKDCIQARLFFAGRWNPGNRERIVFLFGKWHLPLLVIELLGQLWPKIKARNSKEIPPERVGLWELNGRGNSGSGIYWKRVSSQRIRNLSKALGLW